MSSYQDPQWQQRMAVRIDYNYMLDRMVGPERGLSQDALKALQSRVSEVHAQITHRTGKGADFLGFLDLHAQLELGHGLFSPYGLAREPKKTKKNQPMWQLTPPF